MIFSATILSFLRNTHLEKNQILDEDFIMLLFNRLRMTTSASFCAINTQIEMMKAVSFMYLRPPGYNAESAKAAELADEEKNMTGSSTALPTTV